VSVDCLVIDANVFKAYFDAVTGENPNTTADPTPIFEDCNAPIYIDSGGQIESEWRAVASNEWFEPFLAKEMTSDRVREAKTDVNSWAKSDLKNLGFPVDSRDKWYIRLSAALAKRGGRTVLITEDVDFYDPTKKGDTASRARLLDKCAGPVCKCLKKKLKVEVVSVKALLEECEGGD
jgi:hypothetical protein